MQGSSRNTNTIVEAWPKPNRDQVTISMDASLAYGKAGIGVILPGTLEGKY